MLKVDGDKEAADRTRDIITRKREIKIVYSRSNRDTKIIVDGVTIKKEIVGEIANFLGLEIRKF